MDQSPRNHGRRTFDTEVLSALAGVSPLPGSTGPGGGVQSNDTAPGQHIDTPLEREAMKKPRPESEPTTPTTFAPPEPKPRKSSKGQFVIQQAVPADGNTPAGWADIPSLPDLRSTADCRDYIKRNGLAGSYRVIIVRDTFSTIARTKVVISFE